VLAARGRAAELGVATVSPAVGATLTVLAAAMSARSVVELGTGTGVTALYVLAGMADDGVLTTIDIEVEHQRAAKESFAEAGVRAGRTRPISGRPLEVLPRLTDGAYDMVVAGGDPHFYPEYVAQSHRLLRDGGLLVVTEALWHDAVADPARRDETTTTVRGVGRSLQEDESFVTALLPVGGGLLVAAKR